MHLRETFALGLRRRQRIAGTMRFQHPGGRVNQCGSGSISVAPLRRLIQAGIISLGLIVVNPAALVAYADISTLHDVPPAPALDGTDSFMGMPVGSQVRVKCTDPAIELNNAKLLAITTNTITVASINGERFTLPKESTEVGVPVNWQRTTSVLDEDKSRPRHGGWGWVLCLFVLAGVGAGAWSWLIRRREVEAEAGKPIGKFKLATAGADSGVAAAPPAPQEGLHSDAIEDLIETRCYGTAIERLEQEIKLKPDDFPLRLQLLKVYSIVSNRKQMDRVWHQIEFHPKFSEKQKQEAGAIFSTSKEKEHAAPSTVPAQPATPQTAAAQTIAAQTKAAQVAASQAAVAAAAAAHAAAVKVVAAPIVAATTKGASGVTTSTEPTPIVATSTQAAAPAKATAAEAVATKPEVPVKAAKQKKAAATKSAPARRPTALSPQKSG
jgi:hypothetical protein